jgi:hypothetical protein
VAENTLLLVTANAAQLKAWTTQCVLSFRLSQKHFESNGDDHGGDDGEEKELRAGRGEEAGIVYRATGAPVPLGFAWGQGLLVELARLRACTRWAVC